MDRLKQLWRSPLSVELENKGSVARDHLAGERTFLAWLRTSLSLVSLGVAIAQLFKLPELSEPSLPDGVNGYEWVEGVGGVESALFGPGSAIGRLESLERLGKPLGATCIALGALCLILGAYRYYVVQTHLIRGVFPPSRVEISVMSLSVGAIVVASFGIIVGVKLHS